MDLKDRLKIIRKKLNLGSQSEFAKLLGKTRPAIAKYELGDVIPDDTFIQLLCTKLHINEHWLRTGEGSMEASNQIDSVVELLKSTFDTLDDYDKQVITVWLKATPEDRAAIKRCFDSLKALQEEESAQSELSATIAVRPARSDKDVTREEVHRMIDQEFDAKEKGQTSSVFTGGNGLGEKLA